jgi:hypothetical protein
MKKRNKKADSEDYSESAQSAPGPRPTKSTWSKIIFGATRDLVYPLIVYITYCICGASINPAEWTPELRTDCAGFMILLFIGRKLARVLFEV